MTPSRDVRAAGEGENRAWLERLLADFTSSRPTAKQPESPTASKSPSRWVRPAMLLGLVCLVAFVASGLFPGLAFADATDLFQPFGLKDFALGLLYSALLIGIIPRFTTRQTPKPRTRRPGTTPRRKRMPKPEAPGANAGSASPPPRNSSTASESAQAAQIEQPRESKTSTTNTNLRPAKRSVIIIAAALLSRIASFFVRGRALFGTMLKFGVAAFASSRVVRLWRRK